MSAGPPRGAVRLGYGLVALLAVGVGALGVLDWRAHRAGRGTPEEAAVTVTVTAHACEPDSLSVPAGRSVFRIVNRSERLLEWEILDGVMVLEERENIAPGLSQRLVARLAPGDYSITCGLLGNPRGRLRVLPAAGGAGRAAPDLRALVGPMAEYQVYLTLEGVALSDAMEDLARSVAQGGDAAPALAAAHAAYQHLRPVSRLAQAPLDLKLDARADELAGGEADPAFTGFQRLDLALRRGDGTAPAMAAGLQADVATLLDSMARSMPPPDRMLAGAALMARQAAETPDPALAGAMLEGAAEVVRLLARPVQAWDAPGVARMRGGLAAARAALAAGPTERRAALLDLAEGIDALRDSLGQG
ncbi:cupredoxin domain-containing protein [Roseomonas haemaphysalidis]|uniref:Cupredoxin domain-containing protein n=1 Tax=Roseomonas haemaphysalidis TaxID=2768162 RepID=A0ABS3KUQ7_9PROT|nr:cupredoxin domain-containing protein [Roseomonas haemaphysalidis]MBO1081206.1 cupredoxin domain-containing protein [Roseomonas haemaphysalidis]